MLKASSYSETTRDAYRQCIGHSLLALTTLRNRVVPLALVLKVCIEATPKSERSLCHTAPGNAGVHLSVTPAATNARVQRYASQRSQ